MLSPLDVLRLDWAVKIGRYTVLGRLGRGAMAEVLAARLDGPGGFSRRVALKRIHPHLVKHPGIYRTLVTEGRLAAVLEHSSILQMYEVLDDEGGFVLVMEYADSGSLARLISAAQAERRQVPWPVVAAIGAKVADGLAYAHQLTDLQGHGLGVVHRDVSPSNILLTSSGEVKLADFGIAAARGELERGLASESAGKIPYMPREQAEGLPSGAAVDLFALGAVLYELATLEKAYPRGHGAGPTPPPLALLRPDFPPGLVQAIERCMAAEPAQRPVAAVLSGWLHREQSPVAGELAAGGLARYATQFLPRLVPEPLEDLQALVTPVATPAAPRSSPRVFGREAEEAAILARFEAGSRVVALVGAPGMGKSALAQLIASSGQRRWVQRLVVDLGPASAPWGFALAMSRALGVPLGTGEAPALALKRLGGVLAARGAQGRVLLVLDTVEQVAAAVRQVLGDWLTEAPNLDVLLTSCERPGVGELVELGPLSPTAARQLFEARRPVSLQRDDVQVEALLSRLEGVPLAIELAAAALTETSGPRVPEGAARGAAPVPAAALHEALSTSLARLTEVELRVFEQCAVFGGGFTAEAAREVVALAPGAPAVEVVLEQLCARSLVRRLPGEPERFGLYAVLGTWGLGRLESAGQLAAVCQRHAGYYLREGSRWAAGARGFLAADFCNTLAGEAENLLLVHERALQSLPMSPQDAAEALAATLVLEPLLSLRGPPGLLMSLLDSALTAAAGLSVHLPLRARAMLARGSLLQSLGRLADAERDLETGLGLAADLGDEALESTALRYRAALLVEQTHYERAEVDLARALTLAVRRDDRRAEALVAGQRAVLSLEAGRLEEAQARYREWMALSAELGERQFEAAGSGHLGTLYLELGQLEDARACLSLAVLLLEGAGDQRGLGIFSGYAAFADALDGRLEAAAQGFERACRTLRQVGELRYEALFAACLGAVLARQGHRERAARLLDGAQQRLEALGERVFLQAVRLHRQHLGDGSPVQAAATSAPSRDNDVRLAQRLWQRWAGQREAEVEPSGG